MAQPVPALTSHVIENLYVEAMLLVDEARSLIERDRDMRLSGAAGLAWACESMKMTTRLMHCVAWLLAQRARVAQQSPSAVPDDLFSAGSITEKVSAVPEPDPKLLDMISGHGRDLVAQSQGLYERLCRLGGIEEQMPDPSGPARALIRRVEAYY